MAHVIGIAGAEHRLGAEWSLSDERGGASLRVFLCANGDAFAIGRSGAGATRDGVPMLGDVTVVRWGHSALLRVDGQKVEILWRASGERRLARSGERCRLCFGSFDRSQQEDPGRRGHSTEPREEVCTCACLAVFHAACDAVRVNCPSCGRGQDEIRGGNVR